MPKSRNIDKSINRKAAVEAGFYDGRFRRRVIADKKKKQNKEWARKDKT